MCLIMRGRSKTEVKPRFFKTELDLRKWLTQNQDKIPEMWIGFYKKAANKKGITYSEALDQALCLGWIDGVRKSIDNSSYTIRFSPRQPRSIWSAVNLKRAAELEALGLMQPPGLQAFHGRDPKKAGLYAYENPYYRKTAIWYVMSAKRDETHQKRLATLIEDSQNERRVGVITAPARP